MRDKQIILNEDRGFYENSLVEKYNQNLELLEREITLNSNALKLQSENKEILKELNSLDTLNEDIFFEMANFMKKDSGLSHNIWLDDMGCERNNKHNLMRIKIQDSKDSKNLVPISISKEPEILAGKFKNKNEDISDIIDFIKVAYEDLVKHWNQEISSLDFMMKYKIR